MNRNLVQFLNTPLHVDRVTPASNDGFTIRADVYISKPGKGRFSNVNWLTKPCNALLPFMEISVSATGGYDTGRAFPGSVNETTIGIFSSPWIPLANLVGAEDALIAYFESGQSNGGNLSVSMRDTRDGVIRTYNVPFSFFFL